MKRIGLITLYKRNYGSALQCYATKTTLEKMGYTCDVFYQGFQGVERYKHYAKEAVLLALRSIRYRGYFKEYCTMRTAGKKSLNSMSELAGQKTDFFVENVLQPKGCSYRFLKKIAKKEEYIVFVTGSDQVWSGNRPIDPMMFLQFAPENKRIAFAASFGTDKIKEFNRKEFKRAINKIPCLSVREESGLELVRELTGRNAERLPDPTVMLTAAEWRKFAESIKTPRKYILAHFLDKPNTTAVEAIKLFANHLNCEVVCFGYKHQELLGLPHSIFVEGDPKEYVAFVDNADLVCTDSFHSTLFSINMGTPFFSFLRQYQHSGSQTTRLTSLLHLCEYENRLIRDQDVTVQMLKMPMHDCTDFLTKERLHAFEYLKKSISACDIEATDNGFSVAKPNLKQKDLCVGCSACVAICPVDAIKMQIGPMGYALPVVDSEKCLHCGKCERTCKGLPQKETCETTAYVAYNTEVNMRMKSASGGVFSALAESILEHGGVVFGANLKFIDGVAVVEHIAVNSLNELPLILGSKYVQSDCRKAYLQVKDLLKKNVTVLFGGTSCQINGLYQYLGNEIFSNLYTVDLVCHGVPGVGLFNDYIRYLAEEYKGKVIGFSFRQKCDGKILYKERIDLQKADGSIKKVEISNERSGYYRMFLAGESYRDACYNCAYASIEKPADITIGDYFEIIQDYPQLVSGQEKKFELSSGISCMLVRTKLGEKLLQLCEDRLELEQVDAQVVQRSHGQLCKPMWYSEMRSKLFGLYATGGYRSIARYYKRRDMCMRIPKLVFLALNRVWKH